MVFSDSFLANRKGIMNIEAAQKDNSLSYLEELLSRGFTEVEWKSSENDCRICQDLNSHKWNLQEFIDGLVHEAPIFEKSHVGCLCSVIVKNLDTGEEIEINKDGII